MDLRLRMALLGVGMAAMVGCSVVQGQAPAGQAPGGQSRAGAAGGGRTVAVTVGPVIKGPIQAVLAYSGTIQAKAQVNLVPRTAGRIEKLPVDVGDSVKAGDVVAQMERTSAQLQVTQAEAALVSAKARLANVKNGARPEDVAASEAAVRVAQARVDQLTPTDTDLAGAQATVAAAQAQVTKAENDFAKFKNWPDPDALRTAQQDVEKAKGSLWAAQANRDGTCGNARNASYQCEAANASTMSAEISVNQAQAKLDSLLAGPKPEDVANGERNLESAKAALASARARLEQVQAGPKSPDLAAAIASLDQAKNQLALKRKPYTDEDLKISQAALDQAQATLDGAKLALNDTALVAPFDGIVASRALSEGALASTQTPVVSIVSKDVELIVAVEEARIGLIRPELPVILAVPAYLGETFPGKVSGIAPVADAKAHTFQVKIAPDNNSGKLRVGMFAEVRITTDRHENALLVPKESILQQADRQVLFVAKDGQASRRVIRSGLTEEKLVEVLEGVGADDQVIVAGHVGLNDGDRILIPGQAGQQGRPQGAPGAAVGQPGGQGAPGGQGGVPGKPGGKPVATPQAGGQ